MSHSWGGFDWGSFVIWRFCLVTATNAPQTTQTLPALYAKNLTAIIEEYSPLG